MGPKLSVSTSPEKLVAWAASPKIDVDLVRVELVAIHDEQRPLSIRTLDRIGGDERVAAPSVMSEAAGKTWFSPLPGCTHS